MPQEKELTFEESIKEVMHTLPPPIRHYLSEGNCSLVAKNLMKKYNLHIDQGGVLERETILLLMGIENPTEFATSLKNEAAISADVIGNIMNDINEQIFLPLQNEMRNAKTQTFSSPASVPKITPPPPSYMSPSPPRPPVTSSDNAPLPPKMAMPQPKSGAFTLPLPRKLLPLGEEEKQRISNIAPGSSPMSQVNLPGAMPPTPVPYSQATPPIAHKPEIRIPTPSQRPATPPKTYLSDPYREPIE